MLASAPTLASAAVRDTELARKIDQRTTEIERAYDLEREIERAMKQRHLNQTQLAEILGVDRSSISRDLNRGMSRASLSRVREVAAALDYELIPMIVPRADQRAKAEEIARVLKALDLTFDDLRRVAGRVERVKKSNPKMPKRKTTAA